MKKRFYKYNYTNLLIKLINNVKLKYKHIEIKSINNNSIIIKSKNYKMYDVITEIVSVYKHAKYPFIKINAFNKLITIKFINFIK